MAVLPRVKSDRRDEPTQPHVPPADLGIRHVLIEQGKHEGEDQERDGEFQETAQERLLRALEQGGGTREGGADDERDEEQERERKDKGQREDALPEPGPDPRPYPAGRGGLDLPDEVQRRLEFAEDRGGANEQRDQADDGRDVPPCGLVVVRMLVTSSRPAGPMRPSSCAVS